MIASNGIQILLITAGGTISQEHDADNVTFDNPDNSFSMSIEQIADEIKLLLNGKSVQTGETHHIAEIIVDQTLEYLQKDSTYLGAEGWVALIEKIEKEYHRYDAFVITHGTNTLGYTSAALSFAFGYLDKPIVLTGSQVSFGYPGSDVQMNLENAIRIAAYRKNMDKYDKKMLAGVLVVLGSAIITGTRAKKKTEFDYDAFKAFNSIAIGRIGNSVRMNDDELDKHMENYLRNYSADLSIKKKFDMDIISLTEFPGMKSEFLKILADKKNPNHVKGIVLRATGAGDPNVAPNNDFPNLRDGFKYLLDNKVPIVVTTQAPDGIASMEVNMPGKIAKCELNAIPARDMSIEAMTVKLAWLIGQNLSYDEIVKEMQVSIKGEIMPSR